jgi:hypothetical protein
MRIARDNAAKGRAKCNADSIAANDVDTDPADNRCVSDKFVCQKLIAVSREVYGTH